MRYQPDGEAEVESISPSKARAVDAPESILSVYAGYQIVEAGAMPRIGMIDVFAEQEPILPNLDRIYFAFVLYSQLSPRAPWAWKQC